jgi:hypothetical protein
MTKTEVATEAGRRLGDTSAEFLVDVVACFDFVLRDLHQHDCIGDFVKSYAGAGAMLVADQRAYSTQTICGLTAPHFPDDILDLKIWSYGFEQPRRAATDPEFTSFRISQGEDTRGKPQLWRFWPNKQQIQVQPPADAAAVAQMELTFIAPIASYAGNDQIADLRDQDLETVVQGIIWRMADFKEDFAAQQTVALQAYLDGRQEMWGRRFNSRVGQIQPDR